MRVFSIAALLLALGTMQGCATQRGSQPGGGQETAQGTQPQAGTQPQEGTQPPATEQGQAAAIPPEPRAPTPDTEMPRPGEPLTPSLGAVRPPPTATPPEKGAVAPGEPPLPMRDGKLLTDPAAWTAVDRHNLLRHVRTGRERVEDVVARTGLPEPMVKRWHELETNMGRIGLVTPQRPAIRELVDGYVGTWVLVSRVVNGRKAKVNATMNIRLKEMTDNAATLQVLLREDGILESVVSQEGNDQPYSIGAYFDLNVALSDVMSSPGQEIFTAKSAAEVARASRVDPRQANAISTAFNGQIIGTYWPYKAGVSVRSLNLFQKMGESYTTVNGSDTQLNFNSIGEQTSQTLPDFDWNYIQGFGDRVTYGSTRLDMFDTYRRVRKKASVMLEGRDTDDLKQYWERAKRNHRMLAPNKSELPARAPSFYGEEQ